MRPLICVTLLLLLLPAPARALPTVWSGFGLSFDRPTDADPTDPGAQDRITDNVWITRGSFQGIYNAATEGSYEMNVSPAGTEWAWDFAGFDSGQTIAASNYAALTFNPWPAAIGLDPPSTVGLPAVLHLIADDIYLDIRFTGWQARGGGAFAYDRALPAPEPRVALMLAIAWLGMGMRRLRR